MDYGDHVERGGARDALDRRRLPGRAAGRTGPDLPEFSLADLAAHVGQFTALWTHVLCEAADAEKPPYEPLEAGDDIGEWYQPLADHLLARLHATTGDAPSWMWIPDQQTAGCVARRCTNELSIHRYDAQTASGHTTPLDAAVALDAIDEIFVMLPVWENPPEASGRTLLLRATEGEERSITLGPEGPTIDDQPRDADLTLTAARRPRAHPLRTAAHRRRATRR